MKTVSMVDVMKVVKVMITEMVDQEWEEYSNWRIQVYPNLPKDVVTEATHDIAVEAIELCAKAMCDLGENKIGKYCLGLIQEKIVYDEEMLLCGSPLEEFAAIGVLRAWLREYEDCEINSVKFRMNGTWEVFEEDITIQ